MTSDTLPKSFPPMNHSVNIDFDADGRQMSIRYEGRRSLHDRYTAKPTTTTIAVVSTYSFKSLHHFAVRSVSLLEYFLQLLPIRSPSDLWAQKIMKARMTQIRPSLAATANTDYEKIE